MNRFKQFLKNIGATPDPSDYVETAGYTEDFQNSMDMSEIVASKALSFGCNHLIYSGPGGDRSVIVARQGSPFSRFLEAQDAAIISKEDYYHGTMGYKRRELIRIPTTPGQVMMLSYMQQVEIQQASGDVYEEEVEFGSHVGASDPDTFEHVSDLEDDVESGHSMSKVKDSDLDIAQLEEVSQDAKVKRRTAMQTHPDVMPGGKDMMVVSQDLLSARKPREATDNDRVAVEIDLVEEGRSVDLKDVVRDGILSTPVFEDGNQVLDDENLMAMIVEKSGESIDMNMGIHIRGYMPRIVWGNYVQASVEEYNLYDSFVNMSLGDALYVDTLRKWLQAGEHIRCLAAGGYTSEGVLLDSMSARKSVRPMGNPLEDMRAFIDAVFRKQPIGREEVHDSDEKGLWGDTYPIKKTTNGHQHIREQPSTVSERFGLAKTQAPGKEKTETELMDRDSLMGFSMFRQYVEIVVYEGERRMPNNTRAIGLMLSACNGISALYEEVEARRYPSADEVETDDVVVSMSKLRAVYDIVRSLNESMVRNIDEIVEHMGGNVEE
jgi:hypothetical protein